MEKRQDHIWSFPLVGAILTLIGLFTPASRIDLNLNWMWGLRFQELDPSGTFFYWYLLLFLYNLTPFIILLISSTSSIVLAFLIRRKIRKNEDVQRYQKLLYIFGGLYIIGSIFYFFLTASILSFTWILFIPGFASIAPMISGGIIIFGNLFNKRFLMRHSERPDLIKKIKKFYRNILFSLVIGGIIFLVGSMICFSFITLLPGDPIYAYLAAMGNPSPSPAEYEAARQVLGFNLPYVLQYIKFLCQTFTGNLGISVSVAPPIPVVDLLVRLIPRMVEVIFFPLLIAVVSGILLGRSLAKKRGKWYDKLIRLLCILVLAFPIFIIGMAFQYYLAFRANLIPATYYKDASFTDPTFRTGFIILDSLLDGNFVLAFDIFYHLMTPMIILGVVIFALITLLSRSYFVNKVNKKSLLWYTVIISIVFSFVFMSYTLIDINFRLFNFGSLVVEAINLYDYFLLLRCIFTLIIILTIVLLVSTLSFSIYKFVKSVRAEPQLKSKLDEAEGREKEDTGISSEESIKEFLTRRVKNPLGIASIVLGVFFIIIAIFPQLITQYTLQEALVPGTGAWNHPSAAHPLGQTSLGRDVLALVMYGIGDSMLFGIIAALIGMVGGIPLGYIAGRFRKWGYKVIIACMIFFYILPLFLTIILYNSIIGYLYLPTILNVGVLLIPIFTLAIANVVSGNFKRDIHRIGKKLLSQIPLNFAIAVVIYTTLGFLGSFFGFPSLGDQINTARTHLLDAPFATFWPGFTIFGMVLTFLLLYLAFQQSESTSRSFKMKFWKKENSTLKNLK
ncbi:MAG: ABC transporter permease subunit [Candidatus Odinarchaeota archaeon]